MRLRPRSSDWHPAALLAALLAGCGEVGAAEGGAPAKDLSAKTAAQGEPAVTGRTRNVIVYLVDTLRADHLGCYGYGRATSPRIDAFAREGLLFTDCLAQSTWTKAATASVLTGTHPARHGATNPTAQISASVPTLAERLSAKGWNSGAYSANGWLTQAAGFWRGFDTFKVLDRELAEHLVDQALAWIEEGGEKPFFLYVHSLDPHDPYIPPPAFDRFDPDYAGSVAGDVETPGLSGLSARDLEHLVSLYDGEIAYADAQFGRLLDGLEQLGRSGDTAVIFISDHGEEFSDHGSWRHGPFMYQEVVRVPLICRLPGLPEGLQGARIDALSQQIDVVPTVLQVLGLSPDPTLPGRSLLDQALRPPAAPAFGVSETDFQGIYRRAVVGAGLKYVRQWTPTEQELLFDLARDPQEKRNLLPEQDAAAEPHRQFLEHFLKQTDAGFSLSLQNGGAESLPTVIYFATAVAPLAQVRLFYDEWGGGKGLDGPVTSTVERLGGALYHVTSAAFTVAPGDTDGVLFVPSVEDRFVTIGASVGGAWVPPERILLGPSVPATAQPISIQTSSHALDAPRFPAREALALGEPYRIRVWRNMTALTEDSELSDETRSALQALGYVTDD